MSVGDPLVSVVIPTHNRMHYLPDTVKSVCEQSYVNWELIIVDDGSTDGTADYLCELKRRDKRISAVFHSRCANPSRLRNAGIARARGDYLTFLDSDDVWMPNKLTEQVSRVRHDPHCRWSYTDAMSIDDHGEEIAVDLSRTWKQPSGWILDQLISADAAIALPTVLAERNLVLDVGGFDESVRLCEDYDLWFQFASRSPVLFVPEMLTKVRRHSGNYSHYANQPGDMDRWWLYICKKIYGSTTNLQAKLACQRQIAFRMRRLAERCYATGGP
jgi:glycosyltransferase involved in cell wall biosynthesis